MLEVKNISVKIGNTTVLEKVNFQLGKGKLLALVGPNGAGKSTLLKVLSGDLSYSGNVSIHNTAIKHFKPIELAQLKAVMSQKSTVNFDFLVKEVTMMGRYPHFNNTPSKEDEKVVSFCHQKVEISSFEDRVHTALSGGEQQRNHFSRTLAQLKSKSLLSKLMLLDEPLNNLDIKYQYRIMELVKEFVNEGNTAIIVLHDLNIAAEFADEILMMKNGKILKKGSVYEVFDPEILTQCYDLPSVVQPHPIKNHPMVFFNFNGEENKINNNYNIVNSY